MLRWLAALAEPSKREIAVREGTPWLQYRNARSPDELLACFF
jgi:hypothetical protein